MGEEPPNEANEVVGPICPGCHKPLEPRPSGFGYGRARIYHSAQCRRLAQNGPVPPPVTASQRGQAKRAANAHTGRKLIDPITCERHYTDEETAWLKAVDRYRREAKRPFPTASELLQVAIALGYRKVEAPGPLPGVGAPTRSEGKSDVSG